MYVFRIRGSHTTLIEMTQKEYLAALEMDFRNITTQPRTSHKRIPAGQARQYVKDGGHHKTGLWVDEGKVRYAEADPNDH